MRRALRSDRLAEVLESIDRANAGDPLRVTFEGMESPAALVEGCRAHRWVQHLRPDAPDPLLIAARGHHLRRWEIPRESYPRTRESYLAWRTRLYDFHAEAVAEVMQRAGYPEETIAHAKRLLRKQGIKVDADAQTHEDAVSLAFLEVRLGPFTESVTNEQLTRALRRTWRKMSAAGHEAALTLNLEPRAAEAVRRALAE